MSYTLGQAARAAPRSKPAVARAIHQGKLSEKRKLSGLVAAAVCVSILDGGLLPSALLVPSSLLVFQSRQAHPARLRLANLPDVALDPPPDPPLQPRAIDLPAAPPAQLVNLSVSGSIRLVASGADRHSPLQFTRHRHLSVHRVRRLVATRRVSAAKDRRVWVAVVARSWR